MIDFDDLPVDGQPNANNVTQTPSVGANDDDSQPFQLSKVPGVTAAVDEGRVPQAGDPGYNSGEAESDPLGNAIIDTASGAIAAPLASALVDAGPAVVGNEIGSLGGGVREGALGRTHQTLGISSDSVPEDALSKISQGAQAGKITPAQEAQAKGFWMNRAANRKGKNFADGGEVAPSFDSLPDDAQSQPSVVNQPPGQTTSFDSLPDDSAAYSTPGQQLLTGVEGAAQGVLGPAAPYLETKVLGTTTPEDIKARQETNPGEHFVGQLAGLAGSTVGGFGLGAGLGAAGEAASAAAGLGAEGAGLASKIGSAVVKGAVENAVFQGQDEVSKMIIDPNRDPAQAAQTALADTGLAAVIGGAVGGVFGSAGPLWDATIGPKVGGVLAVISKHASGGGAPVSDAVGSALDTLGIQASPEIRSTLSSDPMLQQMAKDLEQSDTTGSGMKYQDALRGFKKQLGDSLVSATGLTPEQVEALPEFSKAAHGENIGSTLAKEYSATQEPISQRFQTIKDQFSKKGLIPSASEKADIMSSDFAAANDKLTKLTQAAVKAQAGGDPGAALDAAGAVEKQQALLKSMQQASQAPGTVDSVATHLSELADREGWIGSGTPVENEFNRVLKQLPKQNTISGLIQLGEQVGKNTRDAPYATPLSRAGSMMRQVLDGGVEDATTSYLSEEAPELLQEWQDAKSAYRSQAQIKDALDERLHLNGTPSNYGKLLATAAKTDSETVASRLSGKNDSNLFDILNQCFPQTADAVRQMHLHDLLERATRKAPAGETINVGAMRTALQNMSPETRRFAMPPALQQKMEATGTVLEQLAERPHNFSNSGRAAASQLIDLPGSAMAMAAMITGHSPVMGAVVNRMVKALGKDAPDAIKLAMLKYLGSDKPISAGGFKAMVDYAASVAKGESTMNRAVSSIFKFGKDALPAVSAATIDETSKLDRALKPLQLSPDRLMNSADKLAHYAPEHGSQMATTVASVTNTLNALRPNTSPKSPLDQPRPASPAQLQAYNKALGFAQKPLSILGSIKTGQLTAQDVGIFQSMYPALYTRLSQKLMSEAMNQHAKGVAIPYQTKIALSRFMSQPMDPTLTPQAVFNAQPTPPQAQPPTATTPASNPKRSTAKLDGMATAAETQSQARATRANKQ